MWVLLKSSLWCRTWAVFDSYAVITVAVGGASWYLARLAQGPHGAHRFLRFLINQIWHLTCMLSCMDQQEPYSVEHREAGREHEAHGGQPKIWEEVCRLLSLLQTVMLNRPSAAGRGINYRSVDAHWTSYMFVYTDFVANQISLSYLSDISRDAEESWPSWSDRAKNMTNKQSDSIFQTHSFLIVFSYGCPPWRPPTSVHLSICRWNSGWLGGSTWAWYPTGEVFAMCVNTSVVIDIAMVV